MEKETSEIVKLTERISKDPKSKLFVPLAEEYKKAGDLEMAIHVLSEGLKNNPTYITARSVLGKLLFEKGDLKASQKEFEEVVRAIPDNLMAQRKLADLHVLQNQPDEALKHYKIVLSLTPKNEEVTSLISDIEAGCDVLTKLKYPKSLSSNRKPDRQEAPATPSPGVLPPPQEALISIPESPPKTEQPSETASLLEQAEKANESIDKETQTSEPEPISVPRADVPEAPIAAEAVLSVSHVTEEEEPEEVLTIEPIEWGSTEPGVSPPAYDFLAEQEQKIQSGPVENTSADILFPAADRSQAVPEKTETPAEPAIDQEQGTEETASIIAGIQFEADVFEKEIAHEKPQAEIPADEIEMISTPFPDAAPTEAEGEVSGKFDDFTTDTLAELYIGQGFYEKAIDIYQRMLTDNPNSQGLKDKLDRVRSMAVEAAGQTAPMEEIKEFKFPVEDTEIFSSSSRAEPSVVEEPTTIEAEVLPEPIANRQDEKGAEEGIETKSFAEVEEASSFAGPQETTMDTAFLSDVEAYQPEEEPEVKNDKATPAIAPTEEQAAEEIVIEAEILSEPKEEKRRVEALEKKAESFFGKPREYRPSMEKEERPAGRDPGADLFISPPSREFSRLEPLSRETEPREFIPSKSELKPADPKVEQANRVQQPSKTAKKETIDRLETWLRNIKKER